MKTETISEAKGTLGEFSVSIDGRKSIETTRFLYPRANQFLQRVRTLLESD